MAEEKCIFCNYDSIKEDILWESDNSFVKVGVGILAPGHVMIIPKKHISCFGELPKQLTKEFISLKEDVFSKIKFNFSEPIIYEHGIYSQTVNHAHIHFVPTKNEYYNLGSIKEDLFKGLKSTRISNMSQLIPIFKEEGSYFYLEEKSQKWVFHTKNHPEKKFTFRKEFARLTGLHGLTEWKNMGEEEILSRTSYLVPSITIIITFGFFFLNGLSIVLKLS